MNNILMNSEMTRAILDGRKTQTRRVAKVQDVEPFFVKDNINEIIKKHSKYQKDEVIWVREPVKILDFEITDSDRLMNMIDFEYSADGAKYRREIPRRFRKDNNYPKWIKECKKIPNGCIKEMARIFLKITDVRVERLQDINLTSIDKECIKIKHTDENEPFDRFKILWNKTVHKGCKWDDNPYVFVYEFERVDGNSYEIKELLND